MDPTAGDGQPGAAGGGDGDDRPPGHPAPPARRPTRRGSLALAGMLGVLQDMLEGRERHKPEIVRQADDSGAGDDDEPLVVDLDPMDASQSVARVRPWLRRR